MLCRSLIDARQGRAGQVSGAGHGLLDHKRRKLPKSAALKEWIRMAISRLGRTAVAASGLAALAAVVIWFGILPRTPEPRRSPPGGETSAGRGADSGTPEARPAQPAPAATAPPAETRRAEPSVPAAAPSPAAVAEPPAAAAAREAPVAP